MTLLKNIGKYKEYYFWGVLFIAFFLRVLVLYNYGLSLTLNSDDAGYQRSANVFLEKFMLIYHDPNTPTVHIMPGQTLLLASIFKVFGTGDVGVYAAKIMTILIGVASVYVVYLIGKYLMNVYAGLLAAFLMATFIPQVLVDNLLLTESPFTLSSLLLFYFSVKLANEQKNKDFYYVLLVYFISLFFRPTIALYPILLFVFLVMKKYPFVLMKKQIIIAIVTLLLILGPWWIRNYIHFNEFIPLTGGSGDPLLLGTYQGRGFPEYPSYDEVLAKMKEENPNINAYESMKYEQKVAEDRINKWIKNNHKDYFYSTLVLKPRIFWETQFYWIEIFNITSNQINKYSKFLLSFALLSFFATLILIKNIRTELLFLFSIVLYFTYLNSFYFAYDRYNLPLMPILFIFIGIFISFIVKKLVNGR